MPVFLGIDEHGAYFGAVLDAFIQEYDSKAAYTSISISTIILLPAIFSLANISETYTS